MSKTQKGRCGPRPEPNPNPVTDLLAALDGARIPGGCAHCDAYQVVQAHALGERNLHFVSVYHDAWCPFLRQHETNNTRR